jgi:hypothetical protein
MAVNTNPPGYMADGVLTEGEALIWLQSAEPNQTTVQFDSSTGVNNWSQYLDLMILGTVRTRSSGTGNSDFYMRFNGEFVSDGCEWRRIQSAGSGNSATDKAQATNNVRCGQGPCTGTNSSLYAGVKIELRDINSGKHKHILSHNSNDMNGSGQISAIAGTWLRQDPITRIDLLESNGFENGSRFDLYGILPSMSNARAT